MRFPRLFPALLFLATAAPALAAPAATPPKPAASPKLAEPSKLTDPPKVEEVEHPELIAHLRPTCLRPASFDASAMRRPLRLDPAADLKAARTAVAATPADLEARWRLAEALEATDSPQAPREWRTVHALVEARLKAGSPTPELVQRQVVAMLGALTTSEPATRVVQAAERLRTLKPESWKAHVLCGDAYFRRADHAWRGAVAQTGKKDAPSAAPPAQLRSDLEAARKEYDQAVALAPGEGEPRAARISLRTALPLMASFLPAGALPAAEPADAHRKDLLEWLGREGSHPEPAWHTALYFACSPTQATALSAEERAPLERALGAMAAEGTGAVWKHEALAMWRLALGDADGARHSFLAAHAALPERAQAGEWLAYVESRSKEPAEAVLSRVRARIQSKPGSGDHAALAGLLADTDANAALDAAREALKLDSGNTSARYVLIVLLLRRDAASEEARYHLIRLWNAQPEDPEAVFTFLIVQAMDQNAAAARHALEDFAKTPDLDTDLRARAAAALSDLKLPPAGK